MVQEGKDLGRIQGVRGEVDDRSGQVFGHREIAGLKSPALEAGLNRMQGGAEPVAHGDPGLFGRCLEGWAIVDPQGIFQEAVVWKKSPGHVVLALPFQYGWAIALDSTPVTGRFKVNIIYFDEAKDWDSPKTSHMDGRFAGSTSLKRCLCSGKYSRSG